MVAIPMDLLSRAQGMLFTGHRFHSKHPLPEPSPGSVSLHGKGWVEEGLANLGRSLVVPLGSD